MRALFAILAATALSGCAGLAKHLSQYDRIYAVEIQNPEGASVKASLNLSKRRNLK